MYKIKFYGNGATSGKMDVLTVENGKSIKLPKHKYSRKGFKFAGWSTKRNDVIYMKRFQLGKVKYKDKAKVKNIGKDGKTVYLYACWKGYGPEAAALWARLLSRDNRFKYGAPTTAKEQNWYHGRDRAHQLGCHYCKTTVKGPKRAEKGSKWDYTYCCNPFAIAAFTHGANMWKKCKSSGLSISWWLGLRKNKERLFKKLGFNVSYDKLNPGDILLKPSKHVMIYTGKNKKGEHRVTHAAGAGWTDKSIRTQKVKGTIGKDYIALKYIGR